MAQKNDWQPWPQPARDLRGAWQAIDDLRWRLNEMRMADEIADQVADRLRSRRIADFSWAARIGGFVIVGCAIATAIAAFVR